MPTIGWIDALRQYNAGMPSWCIPRKGTPGYERVMRIRQGEKPKGFKEVLEDLERKTSGKPKGEKKSMKIDLTTQSAEIPTMQNGEAKTDRPPAKSSTHKTMAVVPVNYVAEGGSPKEEAPHKFKPEVTAIIKKLIKVDEKIDQLKKAHKTQDKSPSAKTAELKPLEAERRALMNQQKDEMAKDVRVYEPPKVGATNHFRVQQDDDRWHSYGRLRIRGKTIEVSKKEHPTMSEWSDITNRIKDKIEITDAEVRIGDHYVLHRVKKPRIDDLFVTGMKM